MKFRFYFFMLFMAHVATPGYAHAQNWKETTHNKIKAYEDLMTGYLWTHEDFTGSNKTFDNQSDISGKNRGCIEYCIGLDPQDWKTPSLDDYLTAYSHGLGNRVTDTQKAFWTSTEDETYPQNFAYFIFLNDGTTGLSKKYSLGNCRCVYKNN